MQYPIPDWSLVRATRELLEAELTLKLDRGPGFYPLYPELGDEYSRGCGLYLEDDSQHRFYVFSEDPRPALTCLVPTWLETETETGW